MFAFQRADSIRPALNNSVERHSTDQEDTGTVTQVNWHKNGPKAQLEAAWTGRCLWFCTRSGWWQLFLAFHIRTNTGRQIKHIWVWCPCRRLSVCFSFSSLKESALKCTLVQRTEDHHLFSCLVSPGLSVEYWNMKSRVLCSSPFSSHSHSVHLQTLPLKGVFLFWI